MTLVDVLAEAMLLLGESENSSVNYDARAEAFWRETGIMAPGKSVPAEWGNRWTYEQRDQAWRQWHSKKLAEVRENYAALGLGSTEDR